MENPGPQFLHHKYRNLNASEGVQDILDLTKPGEQVPLTDPDARIQAYLDFLKGLVDREDTQERERGIDAIKQSLYANFVIKSEEIPEAYFQAIEQRNRDEGRGDIKLPDAVRQELAATLINDQRKSLERWIDHLCSDEMRSCPDWLKYFVMRSVLNMGRYDKEKKAFTDRRGGVTAPFPDLNHDALIIVVEDLEAEYGDHPLGQKTQIQFISRHDISAESKQKYTQYLEQKNFAKLYALTMEEYKPIPEELLKNTKGEWRTYAKGSDPKPLVDSIAPYGTGWCLRGEGMARQYLQGGAHFNQNDLHVYYSHDKDGQPTIPRVVMVVNPNNQINEVRGIWSGENLDPHIGGVVEAKLNEHPDGQKYKKKSSDMRRLTSIYYKVYPKENLRDKSLDPQPLTKDDLVFLYGINAPIEGFGLSNQEDPRIAKLRATRDPKADVPIVFDCSPDQIAWNREQVNENTKAYVGPLFPNIFNTLGHLEHIYTKFPEGRIKRQTVEIGGKNGTELEKELDSKGFKINPYARSMLKSKEFTYSKTPEQADLIRLTVQDLGFPNGATTDQIYKKAGELGLELCPAEVGPRLRLAYIDQPLNERVMIGMKQIADPDGRPFIFDVEHIGARLYLDYDWAGPDSHWSPSHRFVFRLPKSKIDDILPI